MSVILYLPFQHCTSQMTRESNDDMVRLVILMVRVCPDFCKTLTTPCAPKSMTFVNEILYKYNKMFDEGKDISKTFLKYNFGAQKSLKVHLKQCDNEDLPKLQGSTLHINFKQATLLALIKLKQIIKLHNYQVEYLNTPRSVLIFHSYNSAMVLYYSLFSPSDYKTIMFEFIIGVCISAYEDAHLIDGSCCDVAVLYIMMTCKDLHLRNQRLKDVIEKFESVGKQFDKFKFYLHVYELFIQMKYGNKLQLGNVKMCDAADRNICQQIEEDDMLSLEEFHESPIVVEIVKIFNDSRILNCPFKEMHNDFYGLVKLFAEHVNDNP